MSASVTSGTPRGLIGPTLLAVPAYVTLLVWLGLDHGWGWGPLGGGLAWTALMCWAVVTASRERSCRRTLLAAALTAPGRVVAVQEHTSTDDDGTTSTTYVPVVVFTTHDGRTVTGQCRTGIRDPRRSLGVTCPIHYAAADPAVFTANPVTDRRPYGCGLFLTGFMVLVGLAVTPVGVIGLQ
ncbi:DUF3592 domain-containing protein [Actinacidiphila oryziradicis]|uniref:DUF3592 domain-containing protein n=1 Tax=Actinacidiphila oryziradicis TaxID=2571141 RepID=A0A4U0RIU1_9ACTN|nr:DUF3592 domain-containing protein [Actinacidiphila oryziradicis]TJZ95455.1 DUF3592 domain-containing protein [Actinacidiphila oryziradicis]